MVGMKKHLYLSSVLFVMLTIFTLSSQTGSVSNKLSKDIAVLILGPGGNTIILDIIIRKLAHLFLYIVLGVVVSLITGKIPVKGPSKYKTIQLRNNAISVIVCLAYAFIDELHQSFVPGRTACLKDVGIDAIGLLIGVTIMNLMFIKALKK
jgi:VanZ family protein